MSDFNDLFSSTSGAFRSLGNSIAGGFDQSLNFAVASGTTIGDKVHGGAVVALNSASGGFSYVIDYSKAAAPQVAEWTTNAAGNVADFSVTAYEEVKSQVPALLDQLLNALQRSPPALGPYDPAARKVMAYL